MAQQPHGIALSPELQRGAKKNVSKLNRRIALTLLLGSKSLQEPPLASSWPYSECSMGQSMLGQRSRGNEH